MADRACELDPKNTQWWQLRALLQFDLNGQPVETLRSDDTWLDVLAECEIHDPENALYDYLAAACYWKLSTEIDWDEVRDDLTLIVSEEEMFAKGLACIENGQSKKTLSIGDAGMPSLLRFLNASSLSKVEYQHFLNNPANTGRRIRLVRDLDRTQMLFAQDRFENNEITSAVTVNRYGIALGQQYKQGIDSEYVAKFGTSVQTESIQSLMDICATTDGAIEDEEVERLEVLLDQLLLQEKVQQRAIANLQTKQQASEDQWSFSSHVGMLSIQHGVASIPALVCLLLLLGLTAFLARCLLGRWLLMRPHTDREPPEVRVHWFWNALLFLLSLLLMFVVFGVEPSRILDDKTAGWWFTVLVMLIPFLMVSKCLLCFRRKIRLKFSLRWLLIATGLLAVLFGIWLSGLFELDDFITLSFDLDIDARRDFLLDDALYTPLTYAGAEWPGHLRSIIVWLDCHGPYKTLVMWLSLLTFWFVGNAVRKNATNEVAVQFGTNFSAWLRMIARSMMTVVAALLVVYLVMLPGVVEEVEEEHQMFVTYAAAPDQNYENIDAEIDKVRQDPEQMSELSGDQKP